MIGPEYRPYVLDTSALLALIEDDAGAERVEELLRSQQVYLPFVVRLEAYDITRQERSRDEAELRLARIRQLPVHWLDQVSDSVLSTAGRFKAVHRLSLGDALIAAFAADLDAILVHKDPEYDALATVVAQERLPLK